MICDLISGAIIFISLTMLTIEFRKEMKKGSYAPYTLRRERRKNERF